MRKLRVLLFVICGVITVFESFAQTFEIKSGVNLSTIFSTDENSFYGNNYKIVPRLLIGVTTEFPITELFSFETGLLFSSKGYEIERNYFVYPDSEPIHLYQKVILNYMDIPLSIKYSTSFLKIPIYGMIGPYAGIALNGKTKIDEFSDALNVGYGHNQQIGPDGYWKRIDYGLHAGAGIVINKIVFGLDYVFGLADISQSNTYEAENRIIGLTLGYKFK